MSRHRQESIDSRNIWADIVTELSPKGRAALRDDALMRLKKSHRPGDQSLYKELTSGDYDFLGFAPYVIYNRIDGDTEELEADWKHKLGCITLVYGGKKKACIVFVNAYLRVNNSILNEIKGNDRITARGILG